MAQISNRRRGRPTIQEDLFEVPQPQQQAIASQPAQQVRASDNFFDLPTQQIADTVSQPQKSKTPEVPIAPPTVTVVIPTVPQISEVSEPLQNKQYGNRRRKMVTQENLFEQNVSGPAAIPSGDHSSGNIFMVPELVPTAAPPSVPVTPINALLAEPSISNQPIVLVPQPSMEQIPSVKQTPPPAPADGNFFSLVATPLAAVSEAPRPLVPAPPADNMFSFELAGKCRSQPCGPLLVPPNPEVVSQLTKRQFQLPAALPPAAPSATLAAVPPGDPFEQVIWNAESHSEVSLPFQDGQPQLNSIFMPPVAGAAPPSVIPAGFFHPPAGNAAAEAQQLTAPQAKGKEPPKKKSWTEAILDLVGVGAQISQYQAQEAAPQFDAPDTLWADATLFPLGTHTDTRALLDTLARKAGRTQGTLRLILALALFRLAETTDDSAAQELFFNELIALKKTRPLEQVSADPTLTDLVQRGLLDEAMQYSKQHGHYDMMLVLSSGGLQARECGPAEAEAIQLILSKYNLSQLEALFINRSQGSNEIEFGPCLRACLGSPYDIRVRTARNLAFLLLKQNKLVEAQICLLASRHILEPFDVFRYMSHVTGQPVAKSLYQPLDFSFIARRRGQVSQFETKLAEVFEFCHLRALFKGLETTSFTTVLQTHKIGFFPVLVFFKETTPQYVEHLLVRLKVVVKNLQEVPNAQNIGLLQTVNPKALKGYTAEELVQISVLQLQFQHQQRLPIAENEFLTDYVCLNLFDQQNIQRLADYGKKLFQRKTHQGQWPETETQLMVGFSPKQHVSTGFSSPMKVNDSAGGFSGFASKLFK